MEEPNKNSLMNSFITNLSINHGCLMLVSIKKKIKQSNNVDKLVLCMPILHTWCQLSLNTNVYGKNVNKCVLIGHSWPRINIRHCLRLLYIIQIREITCKKRDNKMLTK